MLAVHVDTKCFKHIKVPSDMQLLQHDLNCLSNWSTTSLLSFHSSKSTHLSFKCKFTSTYNINGNPINTSHLHKDLGVLISDNLNWNEHHDYILKKAYKTLGLVRRTFCKTIVPSITLKLYISLVRSQLLYCAPVWRPHLLTLKCAKAIIVALTHGSKQSAVTSEPLSLWLRNCHHLICDVIANEMICRVLPYTETQGQNSP